jgi:FkbM family methyltransferase
MYENELRFLHRIVAGGEVAVDAGANEGLYSYSMSKRFSRVYSFEVNPDLTKNLAAYNPGNIEIINQGLSSREGSAVLYIPLLKGQLLTGWASLTPDNCPDTREHLEKQVSVCTLDKFGLERVALVKVDVEGHEADVLEGAVETLRRNRPVVIVEIKPCNLDRVFSFLAGVGYEPVELQKFIGVAGSEQNYIFVPGGETRPH